MVRTMHFRGVTSVPMGSAQGRSQCPLRWPPLLHSSALCPTQPAPYPSSQRAVQGGRRESSGTDCPVPASWLCSEAQTLVNPLLGG